MGGYRLTHGHSAVQLGILLILPISQQLPRLGPALPSEHRWLPALKRVSNPFDLLRTYVSGYPIHMEELTGIRFVRFSHLAPDHPTQEREHQLVFAHLAIDPNKPLDRNF